MRTCDHFCGTVCGFWEDKCTYLSVYFFILLYIDSTACVDLIYFRLFDMEHVLMACMKPTLHICNIHQCIIEDNVCVYSCDPPGLPPSWQLSVWEKAFAGDVIFRIAVLCLGVFVCREEQVCWEQLGSTTYISFIISSFVYWKTAQQNPWWLPTQPHAVMFLTVNVFLSRGPKQKWFHK